MTHRDVDPRRNRLPAAIHDSGWKAFLGVTGGGSGAVSALLETPGASRSIVGAVVPYAPAALADWLGGAPEQACSAPTARAMAMAAWRMARSFEIESSSDRMVGVGCTASLASDRPKLGDHRIHVATQSAGRTTSLALLLEKGRRDRAGEESLATQVVLNALAAAVGVGDLDELNAGLELGAAERVELDCVDAGPALAELLCGKRRLVLFPARQEPGNPLSGAETSGAAPRVVFPGAFNPPHAGHRRMAAIAEARLGGEVTWELSIANVDKPPLDFIAIRDRLAGLASPDAPRPVALTHAATFREKAALFPHATFVVGADTILRIAEPRYYGGDRRRRDEAISEIAGHGCRFLVFGRQLDEEFQSLGELALPAALRSLCDEVSAAEFREDVSSTEVRAEGDASAS